MQCDNNQVCILAGLGNNPIKKAPVSGITEAKICPHMQQGQA